MSAPLLTPSRATELPQGDGALLPLPCIDPCRLEGLTEGFHLLAAALPLQLWTADAKGMVSYVNPQTAAYFGCAPEALLRDGWQALVHTSDLAGAVERWTHSIRTGEPYAVEFRLRAAGGQYRWHLAQARPLRAETGEIVLWVGANTDIDANKRALEVRDAAVVRAQHDRERLQQIIMSAPTVMAIYRGPRHEIAVANPAWERFTGRKGVIGKTVDEVFPELKTQQIRQALKQVYETGETFHAEEMPVQLVRDGIPEETYWTFCFQRIDPVQGSHYDVLVHAVEVTEMIRARRPALTVSA